MSSTQQADGYALTYGNMVNSERVSNYISHVSGDSEVEYSEDPSEIQLHGEGLQVVTLQDHVRDFSHVMTDDLIEGDERFQEYDSIVEMLQEQYPGTENRGGLNIRPQSGKSLNAVLVPMTGEELDFYEDMELGYHLEEVDSGDIAGADPERPVFAAVSHNTGDADPITGYVEDCYESWKAWGEEEAERFAETTSVGSFSLKQWPGLHLENI